MPVVMRTLVEMGVIVDIVRPIRHVLDLRRLPVEHDLYVLKKKNGLALSLAGALHARGAAIVNSYPTTVTLNDKIVTFRILQAAGVPTPASYAASKADQLAPLLDDGPIVVKPNAGSSGQGVRVVRTPAELPAARAAARPPFPPRPPPPPPGALPPTPRARPKDVRDRGTGVRREEGLSRANRSGEARRAVHPRPRAARPHLAHGAGVGHRLGRRRHHRKRRAAVRGGRVDHARLQGRARRVAPPGGLLPRRCRARGPRRPRRGA